MVSNVIIKILWLNFFHFQTRYLRSDWHGSPDIQTWRNLENNALSPLHKLLRNRLLGGPEHPPPPHLNSLAKSVTVSAKTTVHCSPDSSIHSKLSLVYWNFFIRRKNMFKFINQFVQHFIFSRFISTEVSNGCECLLFHFLFILWVRVWRV